MKVKDISSYKWINILIESNSYTDYSIFEKIEWYYKEEDINIYELYNTRKSNILPTYKVEYWDNKLDWWLHFDYKWKDSKSSYSFYWTETIGIMTECIFWKNDKYKFRLTEYLYIAETLCKDDLLTIFVTNEETILKKRSEIYERIKGIQIYDKSTAEEILWLYIRSHWKYYLHRKDVFTYSVNFWLFCLLSFRHQVPHFLIDSKQLDLTSEILFKWESIIKTLDELWFLYYGEINNDISFNIKYYFYNYLTFICWIYDELAIYLNRSYNLWIEETTLTLNSNGAWFKKLKEELETRKLHTFINLISNFIIWINLIYKIRNLVVHTEWLQNININHEVIAMKIDKNIWNSLLSINKKKLKHSYLYENWMIKDIKINNDLLVPFLFCKFYSKLFFEFTDSFFEKLWNQDFIETLDKNGDFYKTIKVFKENTLKTTF